VRGAVATLRIATLVLSETEPRLPAILKWNSAGV
jgi:hypothetical protein